MNIYQLENQQIAEHFLNNYFYEDFKNPDKSDFKNIELIISPKCNLGCKYCYVHKYRKKIFDEGSFNCPEQTIENLKHILNWLKINKFVCNLEIFSGELLAQELGFQVLETIYQHELSLELEFRNKMILIPTNFTFVCSDEVTERIESYRKKFTDLGIFLCLSASFDGKYMEENRPYLHDLDIELGGLRNDEYYDKAFDYCANTGTGLHPMIYSKNIEKWRDNFIWFQEKMKEYGMRWEHIYLLQVRNEEWNTEQIKEFQSFIRYLIQFAWEKLEGDPELFARYITKDGFNILSQPFGITGRGLTCGIQSQLSIRVSDLSVVPCHRTGYKEFILGNFIPDEEKGLIYQNNNVELLLTTYGVHRQALPYCKECPISNLCGGQCLGAQYESHGNLFVPIPSVCKLAHALITTIVEELIKYNVFNLILELCSREQRIQLLYVEKELNKK